MLDHKYFRTFATSETVGADSHDLRKKVVVRSQRKVFIFESRASMRIVFVSHPLSVPSYYLCSTARVG